MPTLELKGRQISYRVVSGESKRYVYLKFRPDLTLEIILPQKKVDLEEILKKKEDWILKKHDDLAKNKKVLNNDELMFKGKYLKTIINRTEGPDFRPPEIDEGEVVFYANEETKLKNLIRPWFKKETAKYLHKTLPAFASKLSTNYNGVEVRELKKWGYCDRKGRLTFNWQLIALPEKLREYVVLHELLHLSEFSHSNTFHKKLASICPDYKEREIELKHIVPL